jgi:hypothetical protein
VRRFLFAALHNMTLTLDHKRVGREASPSVGILNSQTIRSGAHTASSSASISMQTLREDSAAWELLYLTAATAVT